MTQILGPWPLPQTNVSLRHPERSHIASKSRECLQLFFWGEIIFWNPLQSTVHHLFFIATHLFIHYFLSCAAQVSVGLWQQCEHQTHHI